MYTKWESIINSKVITKNNIEFFRKSLSEDEAMGCLYALIFYTGSGSDFTNASAAIEARK
jgi:hypothetical protein